MNQNTKKTIDHIANKFNLNLNQPMPIMIPNTDRETLADIFRELNFKEGAEVGVAEGVYSQVLCEHNPGVRLHCVDAWKKYPGYKDFSKNIFDTFERNARERLSPYNCNIIKKYSMDAISDFPDRSLDFVYVDAAHDIRHVIEDVEEWAKKIKKGGIIAGNNYFISNKRYSREHVVFALYAYATSWNIKPWFVLGRENKVSNEKRDPFRSWFFVI